jgi:hypothetical protein
MTTSEISFLARKAREYLNERGLSKGATEEDITRIFTQALFEYLTGGVLARKFSVIAGELSNTYILQQNVRIKSRQLRSALKIAEELEAKRSKTRGTAHAIDTLKACYQALRKKVAQPKKPAPRR